MSRWKRLSSERLLATTLVFFASAVGGGGGCEVISQVDRSQIPENTGGAGGMNGQGGSGGMTCTPPADDMNECTTEECDASGKPVHTPVAAGTMCGTNLDMFCDDMGACVECTAPSDCGADTACQTFTCTMGKCGVDNQPDGMEVPTQNAGDCKKTVCDGAGMTKDVNDDADIKDDSNACTTDTCDMGTPLNTALAQGTNCGMNANGDPLVCNAMAQCVGCNVASDCPGTDDECKKRTCDTAGACGVSFTAANTAVMAQTDNNCLQHVCDGAGMQVDIADDTDLPLDDGNACTSETCAGGMQNHPNVPNGDPCEEGDACTLMDSCQTGTCIAGTPKTCMALDACHVAGVCDSMTGLCSNPNAADGTMCNDNNACTQTDSCSAGTCTGSNQITCTASDQCHAVGTCDPMTGMCSNPNAADGTMCNDNNACSQTDTCQSGTCTGSNQITCMASDQCHVAGTCDPMTGMCSNPAAMDGTVCTSGMLPGTCSMGACAACGDGVKSGTETCDDGNTTAGDGCNATCAVETGYTCTGTGAGSCAPTCGDGLIRGNEQCDDKNTTDGDGCSMACQLDISCAAGETPVIVTSSTAVPLVDATAGGAAGSALSTISVSQTGVVRKVISTINVTHANTGHLDIFLASPYGPQRVLANDIGTGANYTATTFSDAAGTAIGGTAPYTGTFRPVETISNAAGFVNQTANGSWTLRVSDDTNTVTGTLNSWTIALCVDSSVPSVCGNGIVEANEQCDDGNAASGDGCANCNLEITCGSGQTLVVQKSTNNSLLIPDNNSAGAASSIMVTDMGNIAKAVAVVNSLSHQYDSDVTISLTPPASAAFNLAAARGGSGDNYTSTIFDDAASTAIGSGTAPFRGRFKPEVAFSTLTGQAANGNWTLKVVDSFNVDAGLMGTWSLGLCVAPPPVCGNAVIELGEICDDANAMGGDGCSATCTVVEQGWQCTGAGAGSCTFTCGNGTISGNEQCDDTNTTDSDGCSAVCLVEPGYTCTGAGAGTCTFTCGNSSVSGNEQCDDGNTMANDSCGPTCQWETYAEIEPNNVITDADTNATNNPRLLLDSDRNVTGSLTAMDKDIFKVSVTAADTVVRFETFDSSGRDCIGMVATRLTLLDSAGMQLKQDTANAGIGVCSELAVLLQPGTYYIQVDNSTGAVVPNYFLRTAFHTSNGSEMEMNDTQATANVDDGLATHIYGDHQVVTDTDWYSVTVPQGASLRIETIEGDASETCESLGIDSTIALFNSAMTQLVSDGDTGRGYCSQIDGTGATPANALAKNLAAGTYYIRVTSYTTSAQAYNQFNYRLVTVVR